MVLNKEEKNQLYWYRKEGKIRMYGEISLLERRVVTQSSGQANRDWCVGQTINQFLIPLVKL